MSHGADEVRVESVQAHRKRLRQAFLLGGIAQRRNIDDGLKGMIISLVLAAVACTGCVGYGYVTHLLAVAKASAAASASPSPTPVTATSTVTQTAVAPTITVTATATPGGKR